MELERAGLYLSLRLVLGSGRICSELLLELEPGVVTVLGLG